MLDNAHEGPMARAKSMNKTGYAHFIRVGLLAQAHAAIARKATQMHVTDWPATQHKDPWLERIMHWLHQATHTQAYRMSWETWLTLVTAERCCREKTNSHSDKVFFT